MASDKIAVLDGEQLKWIFSFLVGKFINVFCNYLGLCNAIQRITVIASKVKCSQITGERKKDIYCTVITNIHFPIRCHKGS